MRHHLKATQTSIFAEDARPALDAPELEGVETIEPHSRVSL
jgi:hypothetical protein